MWSVAIASYRTNGCIAPKLCHYVSHFVQGAVLVYDITNKGSFDDVQEWMQNMSSVRSTFSA